MSFSTFQNLTVNTLPDLLISAGGYNELNFYVYNSAGYGINVSTASCSWQLWTYSSPHDLILSKSGSQTISGSIVNRFTVELFSSDTEDLKGKYLQKSVVESIPGYVYMNDQGVVTVI
jgi:hypothetical protein